MKATPWDLEVMLGERAVALRKAPPFFEGRGAP